MKQPTYFPSSAPHRIAHDPPGPQPTSHACLLAQAHLSPCPAPYCRSPTQSPIPKCQFHPSGSGGAAHAGRSRGAGRARRRGRAVEIGGAVRSHRRGAQPPSRAGANACSLLPCSAGGEPTKRSAGKRARAAGLRAAGGQPSSRRPGRAIRELRCVSIARYVGDGSVDVEKIVAMLRINFICCFTIFPLFISCILTLIY